MKEDEQSLGSEHDGAGRREARASARGGPAVLPHRVRFAQLRARKGELVDGSIYTPKFTRIDLAGSSC
jgi:hypothetical protein